MTARSVLQELFAAAPVITDGAWGTEKHCARTAPQL